MVAYNVNNKSLAQLVTHVENTDTVMTIFYSLSVLNQKCHLLGEFVEGECPCSS